MICQRARTALLEGELEVLSPQRAGALERHLAACADCAAEARGDRALLEQFALLRGEMPLEIDVTRRVMARIGELGQPQADEMPLGQWVLSAVAALVCGVMILGSLWNLLPGLAEPARSAIGVLSGFQGVVASLAEPIGNLLAIPFKLLAALASSLSAVLPVLERLAPLRMASATLAMASMSVTIVYFVGRDLRSQSLEPLQKS